MKREKPCEKPWQRLSAEERRLAELLNFKRETWGDEPIGDEEDGYCEDWSSISWTWAALDGRLLASAKALGFDASSWNGGQQDDQGQDEVQWRWRRWWRVARWPRAAPSQAQAATAWSTRRAMRASES